MAVQSLATYYLRATVEDASGTIWNMEQPPVKFGLGVPNQQAPVDQEFSIPASTFQALSPPAGARLLLIRTSAPSLTLKGVTGDTGIALTPAANVLPIDIAIPLGATPSVGIANGSATTAATVRCAWL